MKVIRPLLAAALVFIVCAAPVRPSAAAGEAKSRIVALFSAPSPVYDDALRGFRQVLADSGRPARVDTVVLGEDQAAMKKLLQQADLIFALGGRATRAAIETGAGLPVVAAMVMKKDDLRGSGDHVTGVFLQHPLDVQFRHIRAITPGAKRVAVMYSPEDNRALIDRAAAKATAAGFTLVPYKVRSPGEIPGALESISRSADVLWGVPDKIVLNPSTAREVLLFSFRNRIPFIGLSPTWVKSGALFSLGWDYHDIGAQCASMAAAVLGGRQARSIPPQAPRKVLYSVNRKTAERMKLDLPESLLKDASQIY